MNLTDEQKTALNVGLATRAGWEPYVEERTGFSGKPVMQSGFLRDGVFIEKRELPRCCDDLNAINLLEERLTDEEWSEYDWQLCLLLEFKSDEPTYRRLIHASAEQRAIALAMALNIQIEGVTQ